MLFKWILKTFHQSPSIFILVNLLLAIPLTFLDLSVAPLFQLESGDFYGRQNPILWAIHIHLPKILTGTGVLLFLYLIFKRVYMWIKKEQNWDLLHKKLTAIVVSLILGPGLVVNALLKVGWGRPRPFITEPLGGTIPFYPPFWFNYDYFSCRENGCASFVSGDASVTFWLVGFVFLLPKKLRPFWGSLALIAGFSMGMIRVSQGRHFLSDAYYAGFFTLLMTLLAYRLILGKDLYKKTINSDY